MANLDHSGEFQFAQIDELYKIEICTDVIQFTTTFEEKINSMVNLHQNDKLFLIRRCLEESFAHHKQNIDTYDNETQNLINSLLEKWNAENHQKLAQQIQQETDEVRNLLNEFNSGSDWNLVKEVDGIKVYYKHEVDTGIHSIKMEGIMDSPVFDIMAVIYELDLYIQWWPLLKEVKELAKYSKYRKLAYLRTELPWPMYHRDACIYGYGVDMLESDTVAILVRSSTSKDPEEISALEPPVPSKHVRMDCKYGGLIAKPISPTSTHVIMVANTDPKLAVIPQWLVNMVTQQLAHLVFTTMNSRAKNIEGTVYEERIKNNPEVYAQAKEILQKYFENKA